MKHLSIFEPHIEKHIMFIQKHATYMAGKSPFKLRIKAAEVFKKVKRAI